MVPGIQPIVREHITIHYEVFTSTVKEYIGPLTRELRYTGTNHLKAIACFSMWSGNLQIDYPIFARYVTTLSSKTKKTKIRDNEAWSFEGAGTVGELVGPLQ